MVMLTSMIQKHSSIDILEDGAIKPPFVYNAQCLRYTCIIDNNENVHIGKDLRLFSIYLHSKDSLYDNNN